MVPSLQGVKLFISSWRMIPKSDAIHLSHPLNGNKFLQDVLSSIFFFLSWTPPPHRTGSPKLCPPSCKNIALACGFTKNFISHSTQIKIPDRCDQIRKKAPKNEILFHYLVKSLTLLSLGSQAKSLFSLRYKKQQRASFSLRAVLPQIRTVLSDTSLWQRILAACLAIYPLRQAPSQHMMFDVKKV